MRTRTKRRTPTDRLSVTFAALADPTRRAIIQRLAQGGASVKELAEPFDISGPAISKHLRVLEKAGLVSRGREAQWRPRALEAQPLRDVAEFAEGFRQLWESRLDRLDALLHTLSEQEQRDGDVG